MLGYFVRRLGLPGLGLGLVLALIAQVGTPDRWLARSANASPRIPAREGTTVPSPANPLEAQEFRVVAEGRVVAYPGAEVIVGAEAAGRIIALPVEEKSRVRKGDLIAALNSSDLEALLAEARARILETEADVRHDMRELKREQDLITRRAGTQQNLDSLRHGLETAHARHAAAIANRDRLEALIAKTRILAPIDGVITARHVQAGETIEATARIVTIVDLNRLRIEAEVDEYDTARVALQAPVTIVAEGFDSPWSGRIAEIPDAVVGRKLRPEDPGRPIDARVLPVKIVLDSPGPLKLGQRVEVFIDTHAGRSSGD
jgi:multidrug efflux pump subunit AcrA (membrane-fusion protein)